MTHHPRRFHLCIYHFNQKAIYFKTFHFIKFWKLDNLWLWQVLFNKQLTILISQVDAKMQPCINSSQNSNSKNKGKPKSDVFSRLVLTRLCNSSSQTLSLALQEGAVSFWKSILLKKRKYWGVEGMLRCEWLNIRKLDIRLLLKYMRSISW